MHVTPCGVVWVHQGGVPGYVSIAFSDRTGSRAAVVLVPTELDEAIGSAFQAATETAVCQMLDRDSSLASHAPATVSVSRW